MQPSPPLHQRILQANRSRLLEFSLWTTACLAFLLGIYSLLTGSGPLAVVCLMVSTASVAGAHDVRRDRRTRGWALYLTGGHYLACVYAILATGGAQSGVMPFLFIGPMFAAVMFGLPGLRLSTFAVGTFGFVLVIAHAHVGSWRDPASADQASVLTGVSHIFTLGVLFILAGVASNYLTTARKALQRERRRAEQAYQAKNTFLIGMSQEIRTPMNGILGMADLVKGSNLTEQQKEAMEMIITSGQSLLGIVNDILDLSKLEVEVFDFESKPFSLIRLMESVSIQYAPLAHGKNLNLDLSFSRRCPSHMIGDEQRLRRVVMKLTGNAIRHTSVGSVKLHADFDEKEGILSVRVTDTGVGIPAQKIEAIFGYRDRNERAQQGPSDGHGLGLTLAHKLVEAMGGEVSVTSQEAVGSDFLLRVPLMAATESSHDAALRECRVRILGSSPRNQEALEGACLRAGARVVPGNANLTIYSASMGTDVVRGAVQRDAARGIPAIVLQDHPPTYGQAEKLFPEAEAMDVPIQPTQVHLRLLSACSQVGLAKESGGEVKRPPMRLGIGMVEEPRIGCPSLVKKAPQESGPL